MAYHAHAIVVPMGLMNLVKINCVNCNDSIMESQIFLVVFMQQQHPFSGPVSGTTWVNRYQKGKTSLDFTEARDSERQWLS